MCCDPVNWRSEVAGECVECGGPIDADGESTDICGYSPVECETCGTAPCDESC
jgi:hypothetical protein